MIRDSTFLSNSNLPKLWREFMRFSGAGVPQEGKQEDIEKYSKRTVKVHILSTGTT